MDSKIRKLVFAVVLLVSVASVFSTRTFADGISSTSIASTTTSYSTSIVTSLSTSSSTITFVNPIPTTTVTLSRTTTSVVVPIVQAVVKTETVPVISVNNVVSVTTTTTTASNDWAFGALLLVSGIMAVLVAVFIAFIVNQKQNGATHPPRKIQFH